MVVQHNLTAANTNRQLGITTNGLQKSYHQVIRLTVQQMMQLVFQSQKR